MCYLMGFPVCIHSCPATLCSEHSNTSQNRTGTFFAKSPPTALHLIQSKRQRIIQSHTGPAWSAGYPHLWLLWIHFPLLHASPILSNCTIVRSPYYSLNMPCTHSCLRTFASVLRTSVLNISSAWKFLPLYSHMNNSHQDFTHLAPSGFLSLHLYFFHGIFTTRSTYFISVFL